MRLFKRTGDSLTLVAQQQFADEHYESHLEEWIYRNPCLISDDLFIIGRQVVIEGSKRIDLLAIDKSGRTVIIEVKRGTACRDLVGQIHEYIYSVKKWTEQELERRTSRAPRSLAKEFRERFGCEPPDQFNTQQLGIVVVEDIDATFLGILEGQGVRVLKFSYFKSDDEEYVLVNDLQETPELGFAPPSRSQQPAKKKKKGPSPELVAAFREYHAKMEPVLAQRVFPVHKGWKLDKDDENLSFWFEFWHDAGFVVGLDTPEGFWNDGGIQVNQDDTPACAGIYCDTESLAVRLTDLVRQHEAELRTQVGDFILTQDHKKPDGSWNTGCPIWTYLPDKEDTEALVKCMASYRDAFTGYLDQVAPRQGDELRAYRDFCQQVQPVLAEKVFKATDGWRTYRSEKQLSFGFHLWGKAGFDTGLDSPDNMLSDEVKLHDGDAFPRYIGIYCSTKTLAEALTNLVRPHLDELKACLGDFILSQDQRESDGSWTYWEPIWAYLSNDDNCEAVVKRMMAYRDALTCYLDQILPRK